MLNTNVTPSIVMFLIYQVYVWPLELEKNGWCPSTYATIESSGAIKKRTKIFFSELLVAQDVLSWES